MPTTDPNATGGSTAGTNATVSGTAGNAMKKCKLTVYENGVPAKIGHKKFNADLLFDEQNSTLLKDVEDTPDGGMSPLCLFLGFKAKEGLKGTPPAKARIRK